MDTSFPTPGIPDKRAFIPSKDAPDTAPTSAGTPVLATAPYRTTSVLQQVLPNDDEGQRKPLPATGQPVLVSAHAGAPSSSAANNADRRARPPSMDKASEGDDSSDSGNRDGIGDQDTRTKTLFTKDRMPDQGHPDTAASFHDSGVLIQERSRQEEALEDLRTILIVKESQFGTGNVSTAATYLDIASLLQEQSKHEEAVGYYLKALDAKEQILAVNKQILAAGHLDAAKLYCKVGLLLREQGKPEQGVEYLRKAVANATAAGNRPDALTYQGHIDAVSQTDPRS